MYSQPERFNCEPCDRGHSQLLEVRTNESSTIILLDRRLLTNILYLAIGIQQNSEISQDSPVIPESQTLY